MLAENVWVFRDVKSVRTVIAEIMDLFKLQKLNAVAPSLASVVCKAYKRLGFKQEGILRKTAPFNGELTDLTLFGVLREELTNAKKSTLLERTFG